MRYTERKNFIKPILIGLVLTIADLFFWAFLYTWGMIGFHTTTISQKQRT